MAKLESEAYSVILNLIDSGKAVRLKNIYSGYEVTVFDNDTHSPL